MTHCSACCKLSNHAADRLGGFSRLCYAMQEPAAPAVLGPTHLPQQAKETTNTLLLLGCLGHPHPRLQGHLEGGLPPWLERLHQVTFSSFFVCGSSLVTFSACTVILACYVWISMDIRVDCPTCVGHLHTCCVCNPALTAICKKA